MRKVVLELAVSLDGYIEGPNGEYDWCFTDQDYGMTAFMHRIDSIFIGRKSFELAQSMGGESPLEGVKTFVFSNTLKSVEAKDTVLVSGEWVAEVEKIKQAPGKDIWLFGGAVLTTSFLNEDLVDELRLSVHPILLGSGKLLFQQLGERKKLKLMEAKTYDSGLVSLKYTRIL